MAIAFEYKTLIVTWIPGNYQSSDDELNALGAEGWELVSVWHSMTYYTSEPTKLFYFKRGK